MSQPLYPKPIGLMWDVLKRALFNTLAEQTASGAEYRTATQSLPIYEFDIAYDYLSITDVNNVLGLYLQSLGGFANFYFDAPNDDTILAANAVAIGIGDGSNKVFTLQKATGPFIEPVGGNSNNWGVTAGQNIIYDNGTPVASANYSASDGGFGPTITFVTAPVAGHVITWSGVYYYLCRFKDDKLEINQFMNQMYEQKGLTLRTTR